MKFNITIIGAGRVSYSLVNALVKVNFSVVSIISRNVKSAKALARKFGIKHYSDDLAGIPKHTNLFFLTVPDGEIEPVAKKISKQKLSFSNSYFIHFSGSEDIKSLNSIKRKGGRVASLHLMQSFPSKRIVKFKNVPAAIETNSEADFKILEKLANKLMLSAFRIESRYKPYYHLAGVYALNFFTGNIFGAKELLTLNNIDELNYFVLLRSSLNSVISNIKKVGSAQALSGPVDRGDFKTIKSHISAIKKLATKNDDNYFNLLLKNYIVQSQHLLFLVKEKQGHLKQSHQKIKEFLAKKLREIERSG
ncbi:MAG: DUF2520 domain-containing protein [Ignavibacteria bacterium]|jgi:predicted short-subunit dehydrogenase-like oxidoreductase (DUF2520 family)